MLYLNDGATPRQTIAAGDHPLGQAVWVDLCDPTDAERAAAEKLTGLRVPSRDELSDIASSSRAYAENGATYLSMPYGFRGEDGTSHITQLGFVLSEGHLLTLRFGKLPAFDSFAELFARSGGAGSAEAFLGLAEAIVARIADVLQFVAGDMDHISKATFRGGKAGGKANIKRVDQKLRAILVRVGQCGDTLGILRDSTLGIGRILNYVHTVGGQCNAPAQAARLTTLRDDVASLSDYGQKLTDKVSFLLDAVMGFINIEQNDVVKVLTIGSVVGIPPTFVVGLYGMNFKIPEYAWDYGYAYSWVMIVLSIVAPLVWFKRRGWM